MTMDLDNPAARLHRILEELKQFPPNMPIPGAMAKVLAVESVQRAEIARRVSLVISLPDQVAAEVQKFEEVVSWEILLRWYEPVSDALGGILFMNCGVNQITNKYSDGDLTALQMCGDLLHRHRREGMMLDADLKHIADLISELHSIVRSQSRMDSGLRDFLLCHIRAMEQAIDDIPLRGSTALLQAAAQTYGMVSLRPDLVAREKDSSLIWQKLSAVLSAVTAALSFGTATVQAIQPASTSQSTSIVVIENHPLPATSGAQTRGLVSLQQIARACSHNPSLGRS